MAAGPRLGIDFGTSHTVALLAWPDGRVRPLLFDGSPLLPSAVYAQTDGVILVGRDAVHAARVDPARFEGSPKRRIDDGTVLLGDREVTVPALIGAVLAHVAQEATRVAGGPLSALTLTHPAAWGVSRRLALVEGAKLAGLPQPALMPEPVAAAHYFAGVLQKPLTADQGLLVYDFGGGTFDASVVTRSGEGFDVRAVDGIDDLGGLDLDALIVDYAKLQITDPAVWARLDGPQTTEDRRHRRLLWDDARIAKEMLSRSATAALHVPIAAADVNVTREAFEDKARPLLEQTVRTTSAVLRWAGLDKANLAGLFLVGGSSRVPLVVTLLQRELGLTPTIIEQPELVVAEGSLRAWVNLAVPQNIPAAQNIPAPQNTPTPQNTPPVIQAPQNAQNALQPNVQPATPVSAVPSSAIPASAAPVSGVPVSPAAFHQGYPVSAPPVSAPPGYGQQPPVSAPPGYGQQPPVSAPPGYGQQPPVSAPPGYGQQPPQTRPLYNGPGNNQPGYGRPMSAMPAGNGAEATQPLRPMAPQPPRPQAPPPQVYVSPAAMPAVYAPAPREDPVEPSRVRRSVAVPLLVGILVLALALAGYVVFQNRGRGTNNVADTPTTAPAGGSAQPNHSPHVIPAYNREAVPWWTPDGWKEQRLGTVDQLWISRNESEGGKCDATRERLRVTTQPRGLTGCSLKQPLDVAMTDGSIEAEVKVKSGCAGMWLRTGDKGYMLGYCADGNVRIYKLADKPPGPANTLQEWTFKAPAGDVYVAFVIKGTDLVFYLNGQQFGPVSDGDIHSGKIDVGAFDLGEDTADVEFSEVRVIMPPDWQAGGSTPTKTRAPTPTTSSSGWWSGSPSATPSGKKPTTSTPTG